MPEYAKVSVERDVFGELGWIPNFNVKKSKNNDARHHNFKEFFDQPKDYNVEFTNASKTATEFFRASGMGGAGHTDESISQMRTVKSRESARSPSVQHNEQSFAQTRRSLNAIERMSYSAIRGDSRSKNYANGFVLQSDISNRHRVSPAVVDTVKLPNSIPFLRDPRTNSN